MTSAAIPRDKCHTMDVPDTHVLGPIVPIQCRSDRIKRKMQG